MKRLATRVALPLAIVILLTLQLRVAAAAGAVPSMLTMVVDFLKGL